MFLLENIPKKIRDARYMKRKIPYPQILLGTFIISAAFTSVFALESTPECRQTPINAIHSSGITNNHPPDPPVITGPVSGNITKYHLYNFTITDPDDDLLFNLEINWGDGTESVDCGCGKSWQSGTVVPVSHKWKRQGTYDLSARVSDSYGTYSNWSDPISISMPKQSSSILFEKVQEMFQHFSFYAQLSLLFKSN